MIPSPIDLIDGPLVVVDRFHHVFEHRIEELARLLGVAVGQQLHRALEIGEQHRHLLALTFERGLVVQDLSDQVLGRVVIRRAKWRRLALGHTSWLPAF